MVSYLYMLLVTVVLILGTVLSKEKLDFFQTAAYHNKVHMYYDYLYSVIESVKGNESIYCGDSSCASGKEISLSGYSTDNKVRICKASDGSFYAFYPSINLTSKPFVSLSDTDYAVVSATSVPSICGSLHSDDSFALCYSTASNGCQE
ncbi:TPA: hypothetical protein UZ441_004488 [Escherichia coli]|nr:hypothetical protein [Escherichia coli]HEL8044418.1 hypothetical protein [Escherichia coli]HEL8049230.1 hypothetical protein [Escherichia coli]HEL8054022.1 hypothetical protein [Escherichia coli]HEL8058880.1 hypothetical protein [Escherichia coli]